MAQKEHSSATEKCANEGLVSSVPRVCAATVESS